jgi:hypothetical protein
MEHSYEEIKEVLPYLKHKVAKKVDYLLSKGRDPFAYYANDLRQAFIEYREALDRGPEGQIEFAIKAHLRFREHQVDLITCLALDLMPTSINENPSIEERRIPPSCIHKVRVLKRDGVFEEVGVNIRFTERALEIIKSSPELIEHFERAREIRSEIEALPLREDRIPVSRLLYQDPKVYAPLLEEFKKVLKGKVNSLFLESVWHRACLVFTDSGRMISAPEAHWREVTKALRLENVAEFDEDGLRGFPFVKRYRHENGCQRVWCLDDEASNQFRASLARLGTALALVYQDSMLSRDEVIALIERAKEAEAVVGAADTLRIGESLLFQTNYNRALILDIHRPTWILNPERMYFRLDIVREGTRKAVKEEAQRLAVLWGRRH